MKKQMNTTLQFSKNSLVELNEQKMNAIAGGTGSTIFIGTTSLVVLTTGSGYDMTLL